MAITNQARPFAFDFAGVRYVLPVNPQEYDLPYRTRATYVPTKGGGFEENFGMHIGGSTLRIAGEFPVGELPDDAGAARDGVSHYRLLEQTFLEFYDKFDQARQSGGDMPPAARFYDIASGHGFEVEINELRLRRTVGKPLTYAYSIQMTLLSILAEGERLPDFLKMTASNPAQPVLQAISRMQTARQAFAATVEELSRDAEISPTPVRLLAKQSADLAAGHDRVFLAALQFVAGASSTIPIERAAIQKSALDTRGLAASYGGWYAAGVVPFEAIVALHQIQRSLQRIAAMPALFADEGALQ